MKNTNLYFLASKVFSKKSHQNENQYENNINNYPPYYWHKKNQYELLPQSSEDIIFLGDSITDEGEWNELFNNNDIKNRGISGDTIERILYRLEKIISAKPKK
ncbi:MAG: G-D-S-L family lipolytic protein, partial [Cyanobacteria bacterium P01_A01_bin.84]